jgi:hypothetical protein
MKKDLKDRESIKKYRSPDKKIPKWKTTKKIEGTEKIEESDELSESEESCTSKSLGSGS